MFGLQARSRKTEVNELNVPGVPKPKYRAAYHNVIPFYSKSSSFLKLMQVNGKLACDKDATVRVQYIIEGTELKNDQEILQIFYLVRLV